MYEIVIGRSESDLKRLGLKGTIFLGKHYVKMGPTTSLSNKIMMDVARAHVVLVSGKRGSGKCLHGDTLIPLNDGYLKSIKEIANDNNPIYCLNEQLKVIPADKSEFFEREVDKISYIKLRSGREIKLTPEHPLLTIKGWKQAQELNIGSRIATERKIECFGKEEMLEHEVKLLAYLIAEGHLSNGFVLFANMDKDIVKEFTDCINLFDNNLRIDIHSKPGCFRVSQREKKYIIKKIKRNSKGQFIDNNISYEKSSINKWLRNLNLYGKLSKEKFIPECIFKLPKQQLAIFLNRLFSCDGSIYFSHNYYEIAYASSSEELIRQVQHLLLRFGILSKLRKKHVKCNSKMFETFELNIESENIIKFIKEIGFYGYKVKKEHDAIEYFTSRKFNPNVDTIPKEIWGLYKPDNWAEIGRAFNYSHPKAMRERIHYSPSRQTLLQIAVADQNNAIKTIAESDIFWDEIISIESIEEKTKVYDICVPEFHNFIANDIIVHNSYTLGVIAEEIINLPEEVRNRLSILIFDTMGIYWTMKFKNEKDEDLLMQWDLPKKVLDIDIYVPKGQFKEFKEKDIPADFSFAIKPSEVSAGDWCEAFDIKLTESIGVFIERLIAKSKEKYGDHYSIEDLVAEINLDKETNMEIKNAAKNRFIAAESWGVFDVDATPLKQIVDSGKVSVLDLSAYTYVSGNWNIKNLVIGIVCRKLMQERMISRKSEEIEDVKTGHSYFIYEREKGKEELPLVWIFLDEAHEALAKDYKTPATDALVQILREGRQPGISLVMATQQPGEIHRDVITQTDIVISHRLTAKRDVEALNSMMQSYLTGTIQKYIDMLPRESGSAVILDDNSEKIYPMRVRPRFTWHGGEAPTAVKVPGKAVEELGL